MEDIPTLVLGATADPATPVSHGVNVYQHLADGYLITTEGGSHLTFGYGNECPDALVTDFLVNDMVPTHRETVCEGVIADPYVPVGRQTTRAFADPAEALSAVETEIYYLPEFFYWDVFTPTSVGCTYGGTFNFDLSNDGIKYLFEFDLCGITANFRMTGTGRYNTDLDRFVLDIKTTGHWTCDVQYIRRGERVNITGTCNGKPLQADRADTGQDKHRMPDMDTPK